MSARAVPVPPFPFRLGPGAARSPGEAVLDVLRARPVDLRAGPHIVGEASARGGPLGNPLPAVREGSPAAGRPACRRMGEEGDADGPGHSHDPLGLLAVHGSYPAVPVYSVSGSGGCSGEPGV